MNIKKIVWYWHRLGRMTFAEIVHRGRSLFYAQSQRMGWFTAAKVPDPDPGPEEACVSWPPGGVGTLDPGPYVAAAEKILSGKLDVFRLEGWSLGTPPRWNLDPLTGRVPPLAFGPTLDYRDEALVGNIKYLWEPSRHLHLVTLAQAWQLTGDERYLAGIALHLESWLDQAPYLRGPHWSSALELGIRLLNWALVWRMTGGATQALFQVRGLRRRWLQSVYQHAHFIRGHFSAFSSANNHLIGEAAGLYVAAVTWPFWPELVGDKELAREILLEQALIQNGSDGVNQEQAISYQQFVLDFLIIAGLMGEERGDKFPKEYWGRIENMLEFLSAVMDAGGNVPMIGDADDGYVVRLAQGEGFDCYRSLLATGMVLFYRGDFRLRAERLDQKTIWLLGRKRAEEGFFSSGDTRCRFPVGVRAFPQGGYYILGKDRGRPEEIHVVMDAGPLGYLGLAAHGHADALSLTLSVGGKPFLVDPGTYAYHTEKKWRDYFRGTSAHNTVRVDRCDQSVSVGNFMWRQHARVYGVETKNSDRMDQLVASHDGYKHLPNPVEHQRSVTLDKVRDTLRIIDRLESSGEHLIERFWHFHPQCQVGIHEGVVIVTRDGLRLELSSPSRESVVRLYRGDEEVPLGWYSHRFDVKEETSTVVFVDTITGTQQLVTLISFDGG